MKLRMESMVSVKIVISICKLCILDVVWATRAAPRAVALRDAMAEQTSQRCRINFLPYALSWSSEIEGHTRLAFSLLHPIESTLCCRRWFLVTSVHERVAVLDDLSILHLVRFCTTMRLLLMTYDPQSASLGCLLHDLLAL